MMLREIAVDGTRISGMQRLEELHSLLCYLNLDPPTKVVEIGSHCGGTLYAFSRIATYQAILVSVDIEIRDELKEMIFKPDQTVHLIEGDSKDAQIRQRVNDLVSGKADLLHIDGDHSPEGVNADWENYNSAVRPGGHVVFHDISDGGPIGELFSSLSKRYWSMKFVEQDGLFGWGGFGVVRV